MTDWEKELADLGEELKQARDELRVQMALGKLESRDDWEELEKQWDRFSRQLGKAGDEAIDASGDVGKAAAALGEELKKGYERIRKAMSE